MLSEIDKDGLVRATTRWRGGQCQSPTRQPPDQTLSDRTGGSSVRLLSMTWAREPLTSRAVASHNVAAERAGHRSVDPQNTRSPAIPDVR